MTLTPAEEAVRHAAVERTEAWRERDGERRLRGVVHTPSELARAMAERAHAALVGLGAAGGLADPSVHLVDPSCGPKAKCGGWGACGGPSCVDHSRRAAHLLSSVPRSRQLRTTAG